MSLPHNELAPPPPSPARNGSSRLSLEERLTRNTRWLSENPDKSQAEIIFLCYGAMCPLLSGAWAVWGCRLLQGDAANLAASVLLASPNVLIPVVVQKCSGLHRQTSFWLKFNLWISIYVFCAAGYLLPAFVDLGLAPVDSRSSLGAECSTKLMGGTLQGWRSDRVPLRWYFHAHYILVAVTTFSGVTIRNLRRIIQANSILSEFTPAGRRLEEMSHFVAEFIACTITTVSFAWLASSVLLRSWLATFLPMNTFRDDAATTTDIAFSDVQGLLLCCFAVVFPVLARLDERTGVSSVTQVLSSALAAGMGSLILLDMAAEWLVVSKGSANG